MHNFNVGILGATGAVGQKFIRLLEHHPWFKIVALGASERSAGKPYEEAANWVETSELPGSISKFIVRNCSPEAFSDVDFVFSGLDSSVAGTVERSFAEAGIPVISNAKNHRMFDAVPLLIPEVNPDHIHLIKSQDTWKENRGFIVTNPNCVVVPLAMSLKPIHESFGIEAVILTSMQAISGAGYPGVASLDIMGNVVPHISDEEPKVESEPLKLLASINETLALDFAKFPVHATCVRVPVREGHLLSITVKLRTAAHSIDDVLAAFASWKNPLENMDLPSAPEKPLELRSDVFFPQPLKHADLGNGMTTSIGQLRMSNVFDVSFVAMAHNTIRGAAGGAILNAELLVKEGYLTKD